jgi:hypothetical protein
MMRKARSETKACVSAIDSRKEGQTRFRLVLALAGSAAVGAVNAALALAEAPALVWRWK